METLFDLLQKDFCPPLDSSLIAALLVELGSDAEGNAVSPSQDQIDNLYATCGVLALQPERSQQSEFSESDILQISVKSKKPSTKAGKKKMQSPSYKIILSDIRQQHNISRSPSSKRTTDGSNIKRRPKVGATRDPWTQISSLSTHIASLLPPHPPSFFQSFFHSPIYTTSYDALRAALTSLCKNKQETNYTNIVSNIMDILPVNNGDVDPELKARRTADIRLSVTVADGRATEAFDLVNVLRDLETKPHMGLSHLLPPSPPSRSKVMLRPPSPTSGDKPSPYQWHVVGSSHTARVHMPTTSRPMRGM